MDNGPTDDEYLSASLHDVRPDRRPMIQARIDQLTAMKAMNRANEAATVQSILAEISMAKQPS